MPIIHLLRSYFKNMCVENPLYYQYENQQIDLEKSAAEGILKKMLFYSETNFKGELFAYLAISCNSVSIRIAKGVV